MLYFLDRVLTIVQNLAIWAATLSLILLSLLVVSVIASRYFWGAGIPAYVGMAEAFMGVTVFSGLVIIQAQKGHIRFDVIVTRLPKKYHSIVESVNLFVCLFAFGVILAGSIKELLSAIRLGRTTQEIFTIPLWPSKAVIVLASLVICTLIVLEFLEVAGLRHRREIVGEGMNKLPDTFQGDFKHGS